MDKQKVTRRKHENYQRREQEEQKTSHEDQRRKGHQENRTSCNNTSSKAMSIEDEKTPKLPRSKT